MDGDQAYRTLPSVLSRQPVRSRPMSQRQRHEQTPFGVIDAIDAIDAMQLL
jgi:hypothetical protein